MPRVPIAAGAYQSRSIISGGQRQINLYHEVNEDPQAPSPVTLFPTPGLHKHGTPLVQGQGRCIYRASNGELFTVVDNRVYFVDDDFTHTLVGNISDGDTMVVMKDNGLVILIVTGVLYEGWAIKMSDHTFGQVNDASFYGGTFVDYVDTFFILNNPGVNQWQISLALVTFANLCLGHKNGNTLYPAFDPLDTVGKSGSPDPIAGLAVMHRNLWTVGTIASEIWYNSGAADFTFANIPGAYIEFGTIAPYSLAHAENNIFWLSQNKDGAKVVIHGTADFKVSELSSKGLEAIIGKFPVCNDAVGGCYQLLGHLYYVLVFPSIGRVFEVEVQTKQWTELAYTGVNGLERHRAVAWAYAYEMNLCIDYQNGNVYHLHPDVFVDDGAPITRLRTIPHLLADGKRIRVDRLIADLQGGTYTPPAGPFSVSIHDIINQLGLQANLKLLLEAGNLPSWPGSGAKWLDESGGGYDFFLGATGVVGADDPVFNGNLGGLSTSEFWTFSSAQFFTYDSPNEVWMQTLHKAGAKFTVVSFVYLPALAADVAIFGDTGVVGTGVGTGAKLKVSGTGGTAQLVVGNAGTQVMVPTPMSSPVPLNQWVMLSASVDENAAFGVLGVNAVFTPFVSTYTAPSAGNASFPMQVGAAGNVQQPFPLGGRMGWTAIWQGVALTQAQLTNLFNAVTANNAMPSPLIAAHDPPQVFLRVSYDRGGSWSDALPAEFGDTGDYGELPFWSSLGVARDFVFEISWSAPVDTAFNGVFIEATPVGS